MSNTSSHLEARYSIWSAFTWSISWTFSFGSLCYSSWYVQISRHPFGVSVHTFYFLVLARRSVSYVSSVRDSCANRVRSNMSFLHILVTFTSWYQSERHYERLGYKFMAGNTANCIRGETLCFGSFEGLIWYNIMYQGTAFGGNGNSRTGKLFLGALMDMKKGSKLGSLVVGTG